MPDTIRTFESARVEDGCIILGGTNRNSRLSRKAREEAAGKGWTQEEWLALIESFGGICLKCGAKGKLVADHVTPLYRGGKHDLSNIQPLCNACNFAKGLAIIDYRPINTLVSA